MKVRRKLLLALLAGTLPFVSGPQASAAQNTDIQSFLRARDAFVELLTGSPASDAPILWAAGLKALAQSTSPSADAYLVDLGLFKLDGEAGEEYSCAASKRAQRFSVLMRKQLTVLAKDNACRRFAASRKLDAQKLCATAKEFARRVEESRDVPTPDREGACSY